MKDSDNKKGTSVAKKENMGNVTERFIKNTEQKEQKPHVLYTELTEWKGLIRKKNIWLYLG
jgi:hypothetical protein